MAYFGYRHGYRQGLLQVNYMAYLQSWSLKVQTSPPSGSENRNIANLEVLNSARLLNLMFRSAVPSTNADHTHQELMRTLSIRVRNRCVR